MKSLRNWFDSPEFYPKNLIVALGQFVLGIGAIFGIAILFVIWNMWGGLGGWLIIGVVFVAWWLWHFFRWVKHKS